MAVSFSVGAIQRNLTTHLLIGRRVKYIFRLPDKPIVSPSSRKTYHRPGLAEFYEEHGFQGPPL